MTQMVMMTMMTYWHIGGWAYEYDTNDDDGNYENDDDGNMRMIFAF